MMGLRDRFDRSKRKPSSRRQRIGFAFFWLLVVAYAYFISSFPNFNTESHLYVAFSVVDHGSLNIDQYHVRLGDESYLGGHYYSDKAPGLSFLAVPVYAGLRLAFPARKASGYEAHSHMRYAIPRNTMYLRYAITLLLVIIPSAILAILLWLFLCQFTTTTWALVLAATYALGTVAYEYSTWYFSHQITAILIFGAFLLLYWKVRGQPPNRQVLLSAGLAGFLAGYSVICEYPTALLAALLGAYALGVARSRWRTFGAFAAGMVPAALLNVAYNVAAFGRPFATGYMYVHSDMYRSHIAGGVLGLANPLSYGVQAPSLWSLWQITFGTYRGMFVVSPVLLLFVAGAVFMWQREEFRSELWLCAAAVGLYFLMDASRGVDQNGWAGGWSVASRHLTPIVPFMVLPLVFGLRSRWFKAVFLPLAGLSIALMFMIVASVGPFSFADQNPLFHEVFPRFFHGKILLDWGTAMGMPAIPSLVPFAVLMLLLLWRIAWLLRRTDASSSTFMSSQSGLADATGPAERLVS